MMADAVKRRGGVARIDRAVLRQMVAAGKSTAECAAHFRCTSPSIVRILHAEGIPLPARRYAGRIVAPKADAGPRPAQGANPAHPPRLAQLIATGGRYADLRAWAHTWGVSEVKARQEWHQLRLPVVREAAA